MVGYQRAIISATSKEEAKAILRMLVEKRLAAGGLITEGLSIHRWNGRIEEEKYYNVSCFTAPEKKDIIIREVEKVHKDEAPVIAFFDIDHGNKNFLEWIDESTK